MTFAADFKNPHAVPRLTDRQIAQNVSLLELPEGWTRADDVKLVEGLFMGLKLMEIGGPMGKTLPQMQARFLALREAATGGHPVFTLTAQIALLAAVREAFRNG